MLTAIGRHRSHGRRRPHKRYPAQAIQPPYHKPFPSMPDEFEDDSFLPPTPPPEPFNNVANTIAVDALSEPIPVSALRGGDSAISTSDPSENPAATSTSTSKALIPLDPPGSATSKTDTTHSYILDPSSVRNYDALIEQLLEDHKRPQKTKVHMDVNLSVDVDLTPEVYGDLHLSMMCVTVKRKPWEEDVIARDGRRIAGTVLRISDGRGQLLHRQVVGFESLGEWWWVVRTQLQAILRRKAEEKWKRVKKWVEKVGYARMGMILVGPIVMLIWGLLWLLSSR